MNVTQTGLDSAPLIPVGATISRAYWAVAGSYTAGEPFDTKDKALVYAIAQTKAEVARHVAHHISLPGTPYVAANERVSIDLRWFLEYPGGGGIDLVAQRNSYLKITDLEEALELYRRYSGEEDAR